MSVTLYRKHRPQTFAELAGQRHIRVTLEQSILHDRVAHAYLFTGPRGTGKTSTARILARSVNCLKRGKKPDPCNTCDACQSILENRTLDIMEIDAASQTGVDNVRENIIQSARSLPAVLRRKVFIIDEVHMLSLAAFNALLKILEEPPNHCIFILATTDVHRIPETVVSRTQRFDFHRISLPDIQTRLTTIANAEGRRVDPIVVTRIARHAGGSLRDAESLLGQLFSFPESDVTPERLDMILPRSDFQAVLGLLQDLAPGRARESIDRFHAFVNDGGDITTFVRDLLYLTRSALLMSVHPQGAQSIAQHEDEDTVRLLGEVSSSTSAGRLVEILEAWSLAMRQIPTATIEELPVEIAIVRLCQGTPTAAPEAVPTAAPPAPAPASTAPAHEKKTKITRRSPESKQKKLSLGDAQNAWRDLCSEPTLSPGLALSLKQTRLKEFDGQTLSITVPFALHADRLRTHANAAFIMRALEPKLGSVSISYVVEASAFPSPPARVETPVEPPVPVASKTVQAPSGDETWDSLLSTFQ